MILGKYEEYHNIGTYHKLAEYNPSMSIRYDPNSRFFLMIIDQEESCFKQYSFSKRYWVSPGGGMKLLSKNDRYTQVVSAFYSYSFRFGIDLNEEEMKNK